METGIIIGIAAFVLVIVFFIAKRVLRLAVRLVLVLVLVLVVLAAGGYTWWRWNASPPPRHSPSGRH